VAMSHFHIIWGPAPEAELAIGREAARKAWTTGSPTTREKGYIAAIGAFYKGDTTPHPARVAAFEKAMAEVSNRNPEDHEAAIFHALAILGVAYNSPPDKTYARQKQAAEILNRLLPLEPEHPGIAHYMIHSFDYPELAELALPAARAYAKIAPSAPHALHMPSHIFTRLGMWQESIDSNIASEQTAEAWVAKSRPGATAFDALHAMDYLEYAYLQIGRDDKAREVVDRAAKATSFDSQELAAGYALAAIPARYALERRAWAEAAALQVKPATANQAEAKLAAIKTSLDGRNGFDWATQVEVQRRAAAGWIAHAKKQDDQAVELLRSAADLEDTSDKHPVSPGSILPAREQLADLLAELGKPAEALAEYETSLKSAPRRLNSFDGAARAAERAGQPEKAKGFRDQIAAMCGGSIPSRSEQTRASTADY
jgi:tetratricopeptide (TPR) repeat protein